MPFVDPYAVTCYTLVVPDPRPVTAVTSVTHLAQLIRESAAESASLRIIGNGTHEQRGGRRASNASAVSLRLLQGITEYVPEDLVVIAQAGTTVVELQRELDKHGQWLPLEPAFPDRRTLGGIIASRANSSIRAGYGSARDWLIGVEVVDARGQLVKGGGKVVKNVSGYDLPKLYCGSQGTLGAIVSISLKVAPKPEVSSSLVAILSTDRNSEEALDSLLMQMSPTSVHLINSVSAKQILGNDSPDAQYLVVRFDGPGEAVQLQIERASTLLIPYSSHVTPLPEATGTALGRQLRDYSLADFEATVEYHVLSSQVGAYARMLEWTARRGRMSAGIVADTVCGIITAHFTPETDDPDWLAFYGLLQEKSDRVGGSRILRNRPSAWTSTAIPIWSPVLPDHKLMQAIKLALDPRGVFEPGQFYGNL